MNKKIWKNPHLEKELDESQVPLWFWNDKLEKEELIRQLEMQTEIGVKSTNPHARTNNGQGYIGGYLDDEWFESIQTVIDYKVDNQETMWLYDEIDWPAGTCNRTITELEQYREQYITIEKNIVKANQEFRAQLYDLGGKSKAQIKQGESLEEFAFNIAVYDGEDGKKYPIEQFLSFERFGPEFILLLPKDAIVYIAKIRMDIYGNGGENQVNYLNNHATEAFLKSTYDLYYERFKENFGSVITSVFNDETRLCNPMPWTQSFRSEFMAIKKYDILQHVHELVRTTVDAGRIRCDYYDVVATLYQKNYFGTLHNWCKEHNIKLYAHLLGEETLYGHVRYSGDYLRQNRFLDIPGADHLGKGIGSLNIKFTSAGAHSYGKKRTAVEVFAGCGWDMTFEEYSRMVTWMFQQGMQCIINHGFFYSDRGERKNDWPPSQFFQWKGYNRMAEGNRMIRRLSYALSGGYNETEILVYYPIESFWMDYIPNQYFTHGYFKGPDLEGDEASTLDIYVQKILNGLMSRNMDFDLLHNDACENFNVVANKIVNGLTGQQFDVLILPMCKVIPVHVAEFCREFADNGGEIIVLGSLPQYGLPSSEDERVNNIFSELLERKRIQLYPAIDEESLYEFIGQKVQYPVCITDGVKRTFNNHPYYKPYLIDPYIHTGEDITGVMYTRYIKDGYRNIVFMNYSEKSEVIEVEVVASEVPEVWDTMSGHIQRAEVLRKTDKKYKIRLELPLYHSIILVTKLL
jgi:hypothetical protein